jgi:RNA recognition motif-containing protein
LNPKAPVKTAVSHDNQSQTQGQSQKQGQPTDNPEEMDVAQSNAQMATSDNHQTTETNENADDKHDDYKVIEITTKGQELSYKLGIDLGIFPGNVPEKKIKLVEKILLQEKIKYVNGIKAFSKDKKVFIIRLNDRKTYEHLLKQEISVAVKIKNKESQQLETHEVKFQFTDETKNKVELTDEKKTNRDERILFVNKIPAEIKNYQLRGIFEQYGEIEPTGFRKRMREIYQSLQITYTNKDAIAPFYGMWSVSIGKHLVYTQPKVISDEVKEQQYANVIKLTGLPNNTTAWDLKNLAEEYNIKYIHIPRNGKFNTPLKFCFIYFADENSLAIATNKIFSLNGNQLSWVPTDTKTCHKCSDPNYFAADCDYEDKRPRYKNQTEILKQFNKK